MNKQTLKLKGRNAHAKELGAMIELANKKNQREWKIVQVNGWYLVVKAL